MRVLHQNKRTGEMKLYLESLDDLWHLKNLVEAGDLVFADTFRRKEEKADKIRPERPDKRKMRLGIRTDRVEFQESQDKIRVMGIIEVGPQDLGQHHTLMLGPGDIVSIIKEEWKRHEIERVRRAVSESAKPAIFFISIDDREGSVLLMTQFSVKELGTATRRGTGKLYESRSDQAEFFDEIIGIVKSRISDEPLIIFGPGFAKEALFNYLKKRVPDLTRNASIAASSQTGATGVSEIIKRGLGGKILEESRMAVETRLMEELLLRISKDEPVTYGPEQVAAAIYSGAVDILLLTEKRARTKRGEELMRGAESASGRVEILSTSHDAGRQLESLGGYAAILRFARAKAR